VHYRATKHRTLSCTAVRAASHKRSLRVSIVLSPTPFWRDYFVAVYRLAKHRAETCAWYDGSDAISNATARQTSQPLTSGGDSRLRCGWKRDRNTRAPGRIRSRTLSNSFSACSRRDSSLKRCYEIIGGGGHSNMKTQIPNINMVRSAWRLPSGCLKSGSARRQRCIYIWENLKYLIKPRDF
jgi:hypothetical protein